MGSTRSSRHGIASVLGTLLLSAVATGQATWFVDATANGNGSSWENAFQRLDQAIAAASETDTIKVAQGTYRPTTGTSRDIAFTLPRRVEIYGGFAGLQGENHDEPGFLTVLSGDIGQANDPTDNSYHVITAITTDEQAVIDYRTVLDGFTITDGYANGNYQDDEDFGGGIYAVDSWPRIVSCVITGNEAKGGDVPGGAGVGCRFENGRDTSDEIMEFRNCTIEGNTAEVAGGGVMLEVDFNGQPGAVAFVRCVFRDNTTTNGSGCGGAVHLENNNTNLDQNDPRLTAKLVSCRLQDNFAPSVGGAISSKTHGGTAIELVNVQLVRNGVNPGQGSATGSGGAVFTQGDLSIESSTIASNRAAGSGGGIYVSEVSFNDPVATIENTILWGNLIDGDPDPVPQQIYRSGTDLVVQHSDVQGGRTGVGGTEPLVEDWIDNIDATPGFVSGGFAIGLDSPCKDGGDATLLPADAFDLDGDSNTGEALPRDVVERDRVIDGDPDMGAYEFDCEMIDPSGNGEVEFADVLEVLMAWGGSGPPDPNGDGVVDFADINVILSHWGRTCGGGTATVDSIEDVLTEAGLDYPGDWYAFLDCMDSGTPEQAANCSCWMEHYYTVHYLGLCLCQPNCPDDDPWGNIHQ